ncbi:MAG: hypothetical protein A2Y10_15965 [Planctomycetes bacterium GWF2_41_51]|nr:MAG: hypothetical protein A2Y10_15965 [Planctomycetes bacterium GWF2_41_51]HBG25633.1 hypothetical protein [Phycisphaerales bacterium]
MKKFFGCLLVMVLACVANATDFQLLAHWNFEGTAGTTTVYDSVSNRAATIMNGASLNGTGGVVLAGGSGPNNQYIDLGASFGNLIGSLSSYRVEITFTWDGPASGNDSKLWSFSLPKTEGSSDFPQGAMLTFVSNNDHYTRYIYRRDGVSTPEINRSYSTDLIAEEMTIGIEYDENLGTNGFGAVRTLKNGVQEAYSTQNRDLSYSIIGTPTRNYIGKSPYETGNGFDGLISDFKVYGVVVPEPTTMVMLGFGALSLFRKRK